MFRAHLRTSWNSFLGGEMSYRYQLGLTGLLYHLKCVFPCFLFSWSIHRCEWSIKVSHSYCVILNFPFHTCYHLPYISWFSYDGYIYIYNCYVFFLDWPFYHYVVSFFVFTAFISKSILSDMSIAYYWFLLISSCIKYLFQAPHFQSVCVPRFEVGLL